MTFSSTAKAAIASRHRRLIIDYQDLTQAKFAAYTNSGGSALLSRCYTAVRRQFLPHYFLSPPRWRVWIRELNKDRSLPDFCVIGPLKSGTSDLAVTIMSHPNVVSPLVKELRSHDPLTWRPFYPTLRSIRRHARRYGVALCPFVGPCLHYLDIAVALSLVRPNTKIAINLRNPVDLVFSHWKWTLLHTDKRLVDRLPFLATFPAYVGKAIELFPAVVGPIGAALHYGIYATSVAHWIRYFGETNVQVFDIAEYFSERNTYVQQLETFLGLPHVPLPSTLPVVNSNPLEGFAPTPETSAQLTHFFEPYNRHLWDVIGTTYSW